MTVSTTKERILAAAKKCSTAKETLKTLFPEVFEDDKLVVINQKQLGTELGDQFVAIGHVFAPDGLAGKCLILNDDYDWEFTTSFGCHILIPRKK